MHHIPPQFFSSKLLAAFKFFGCFYKHNENSVDPDQLASKKPADMELQCF